MADEIKQKLIEKLHFGSVDSESEVDLDKKFIQTRDFKKFIQPNTSLILGAKGSGKSALFQMFAKYEEKAKEIAGIRDNSAIIVTGTGFKDIKELSTADFNKLLSEDGANFDQIWELYIAVKIAIKLGVLGYRSGENLYELYKQAGIIADLRIFSIIKSLYSLIIGTPPNGIDIDIKGIKVKIGGKHSIDVQDILIEIHEALEYEDTDCWLLFDKIDELFSDNYAKRKACIESLFRTYLTFTHRFPRIKFKIFLRNDIWSTLNFVNKSHISDKCIDLKWNKDSLLELVIKRIILDDDIKQYIVQKTKINEDELTLIPNLEKVFYSIFSQQIYKGKKEASVISWVIDRITDGLGGTYPREFINLGNFSRDKQLQEKDFEEDCLITGKAVKAAFLDVSTVKCGTYLSEFPTLRNHFERFRGENTAKYTRKTLISLMDGLEPSGEEMVQQIYETGILQPLKIHSSSAPAFEIPKLFRTGLGLTLRGRP